jgi:hypothetical protein
MLIASAAAPQGVEIAIDSFDDAQLHLDAAVIQDAISKRLGNIRTSSSIDLSRCERSCAVQSSFRASSTAGFACWRMWNSS